MGLRIEAGLNKMSKNIFYEIPKTLIFAVPKMSDNQLLDLLRMTWVVGSVVQLVRMPPCHGGGRGFESRPVRIQNHKDLVNQMFTRSFCFWGTLWGTV